MWQPGIPLPRRLRNHPPWQTPLQADQLAAAQQLPSGQPCCAGAAEGRRQALSPELHYRVPHLQGTMLQGSRHVPSAKWQVLSAQVSRIYHAMLLSCDADVHAWACCPSSRGPSAAGYCCKQAYLQQLSAPIPGGQWAWASHAAEQSSGRLPGGWQLLLQLLGTPVRTPLETDAHQTSGAIACMHEGRSYFEVDPSKQ